MASEEEVYRRVEKYCDGNICLTCPFAICPTLMDASKNKEKYRIHIPSKFDLLGKKIKR